MRRVQGKNLLLLIAILGTCLLTVTRAQAEESVDFGEVDEDLDDESGMKMINEPEEEEEEEEPHRHVIEVVNYETPELEASVRHLFQTFDDEVNFSKRWVKSLTTKAESEEIKFDGAWGLVGSHDKIKGDNSLQMQSAARHHAIGIKLDRPFQFKKESKLVVQYEVQFRNGQECGGAYVKLLAAPADDLTKMHDKTPYSIMFGPDKCGNEHKLHFIFMHKNPKNGTLREMHWKKASSVTKLEDVVKDKKWHLFRLEINNQNEFEIQIDQRSVGKGSLLEDFTPSVNPPKEIDDPSDVKPSEWDEREKIPDPEAKKPDDWDENEPRKISDPEAKKPDDWLDDEPENIPDPESKKPEDWDPEMDGEWEPPLVTNPKCASISGCGVWKAPTVDNPKYKGKWKPALITNPDYKGKWSPKKISNPDYFEDSAPFKSLLPIDALAFELWTISDGIAFDNVLVSNDVGPAEAVATLTYEIKRDVVDAETDTWYMKLVRYTNKNPWMWAVYLVLFAVPLVLFIGYCCVTPGKSSSASFEDRSAANGDQQGEEEEQGEFISGDQPEPLGTEENFAPEDDAGKEEAGGDSADEPDEAEEEGAGPQHEDEEKLPRLRKTRARKDN